MPIHNHIINKSHYFMGKISQYPNIHKYATHLYQTHFDTVYNKKYRYLLRNYTVNINGDIILLEHPRMRIKLVKNNSNDFDIIIDDYFNYKFIQWCGSNQQKLNNPLDEEERSIISGIGKYIFANINHK